MSNDLETQMLIKALNHLKESMSDDNTKNAIDAVITKVEVYGTKNLPNSIQNKIKTVIQLEFENLLLSTIFADDSGQTD